ncbi:MAG TPA: FAD-binding oxidoreductase, partial [Acidimicrobiales bacterium]|nr:FAD-binding oxidoreductase [Acidimicrobiales bacterium]
MTAELETSRKVLCGWGRTAPTTGLVCRPGDDAAAEKVLAGRPGHLIARGLGRSYGDAAQCSGGLTVDTSALSWIGEVDAASATVAVGAGTSLHDLMRHVVPAGWFVPVTPGTRYVSVGGAIAADVHGKNHHRDGSFARHVVEMTLATPLGTSTVSPEQDPELFWATAGGMGLTGIVLRATLRLIPIETTWMQVESSPYARLEDLMDEMVRTDESYRYSVAWLDCVRRRGGDVRSILTRGDHAPAAALPARLQTRRLEVPGDPRLKVWRPPPGRLV